MKIDNKILNELYLISHLIETFQYNLENSDGCDDLNLSSDLDNIANRLNHVVRQLSKNEEPKTPKISEEELRTKLKKVVEQGTKDWADVPDATEWIEQLRGCEEKGGYDGQ